MVRLHERPPKLINMPTSLQDQIDEFHRKFARAEIDDPDYLTDSVKALRHSVMFIHSVVERTLGLLLAKHASGLEFKVANGPAIIEFFERMFPILDNMEFASKMKAVKAVMKLPSGFEDQVWKVNTHRTIFSHPRSFRKEISEYKKPERQLPVLKELWDAYVAINEFLLANKLVLED